MRIDPSQRNSGFLWQDQGDGRTIHPRESWHRTLSGALAKRRRMGCRGNVYRLHGSAPEGRLTHTRFRG